MPRIFPAKLKGKKMACRLSNRIQANPILETMTVLNEVSLKYPHAISLGSGRPSNQFCQPEEILNYLNEHKYHVKTIEPSLRYNQLIGQYGPAAGIIRKIITKQLLCEEKIIAQPEEIIVTLGFQEAVDLCMKTLFNSSDVLIVPDPVFIGITGAAFLNNIEIAPINWRCDSFNVEQFDNLIKRIRSSGKTPKAIYTIPDFNNPYGGNMSLTDRHRLLEWAHTHEIIIIEDSPYRTFNYTRDELPPTLKALDKYNTVIYIYSAAKTVHPALRIGYIVAGQSTLKADVTLADALAKAKSFTTVNTPALDQALFAGLLIHANYNLKSYNAPQIAFNSHNLNVMLKTLEEVFPKKFYSTINWNRPLGGYFLTLALPFVFGIKEMHECAQRNNVIVLPLSIFSITQQETKKVRLSFTNVPENELVQAIRSLSEYIKSKLALQNETHAGSLRSKI